MRTSPRTGSLARLCGALLVAICLAACRSSGPPSAGQAIGEPGDASSAGGKRPITTQDSAAGRLFHVIGDESLIQIFAYRGGTLARVGHNHVIASRNLQGDVRLTDDMRQSQFDLTIPVTLLTIDEPDLRAAAGDEFASEVPDSAREGTRKNLLSESLLDGERFPGIQLRLSALEVNGDHYEASIDITIKARRHTVRVPLALAVTADALTASGELRLQQSELGLTPFSVMLGALTVQDELRVMFAVTARPRSSP